MYFSLFSPISFKNLKNRNQIENMAGQIVSYHDNGMISKIESKLTGTALEFFQNGQLYKLYTVRDGKLVDVYVEYYENGYYKNYLNYENGQKHGSCQVFHYNGVVWRQQSYFQDLQHGTQVEYFKNGNVYSQEEFCNGVSVSPQYIYFDEKNGTVQYKIEYTDSDRHSGKVSCYTKNQQLLTTGFFKDFKKNGWYWKYDLEGNLVERAFFKNGLLNGLLEQYDKNGDCYSRGFYKNDQKNGVFQKYDQLMTEVTRYKQGKRHGFFVLKNRNSSSKILSLFYKNDCLDGIQVFHTRKSKRFYRENYFLTIQVHKYDCCSVCWEKCNWKTPCGHFLCLHCARHIQHFQCPMCRKPFVKKMNPVFNIFGTTNFLKQD